MDPFYMCMERSRVAVGGDGLQIWKLAANIWIKQNGKMTMDGPVAWRLGGGLTTRHYKKYSLLKQGGKLWSGCIWLRICISGELL
jgi:hypothetical protein